MTRATAFVERLVIEGRPLDDDAVDEYIATLPHAETEPLLREAGRHALSAASRSRDAEGDPLMIPVVTTNPRGILYCPQQNKVSWVTATPEQLTLYAAFLSQQAARTGNAAVLTSVAAQKRAALIARLQAEAAVREARS